MPAILSRRSILCINYISRDLDNEPYYNSKLELKSNLSEILPVKLQVYL